jgi:uncharacterized protein YqeY
VEAAMKAAMKAKEKEKLTALRSIKSMILLAETEKGQDGGLTEEAEIKLLTKAAKQRRESAQVYKENGRDDLWEKEIQELGVIEAFLPKQLSDEEIEAAVKEIITEVGATSPKEMGKVMGVATKKLAGKADGKKISQLVKDILNN